MKEEVEITRDADSRGYWITGSQIRVPTEGEPNYVLHTKVADAVFIPDDIIDTLLLVHHTPSVPQSLASIAKSLKKGINVSCAR